MTKRTMIRELVSNPIWDGEKDINFLMKNYSKEEIQDMYDYIEDAENDYYN